MTAFILFFIGLLLGGSIGIVLMCCLQINRFNKINYIGKEDEENEKKNC